MKTIRLMADYYSFLLWDNSGNLDPECFPISKILEENYVHGKKNMMPY